MIQYLKNIAQILTSREKKKFITLTILNLLISLADIFSLAILVLIVNFYAQPAASESTFLLPEWLADRHSVLLILVFLIVFSSKNYGAWLVHREQCRFMAEVASRLSQSKLLQYLQGGFAEYIEVDSSVHLRKISFQPLEFCQHILDGVQQLITQSALVLFAITAIALYNAQLFVLLMIMLLPPVIIIFYRIRKKLLKVRMYTRLSSERSLQHLQEALEGFVESKVYHKTGFFMQRYARWQQQFNRHLADYLAAQGMPSRFIEIFALAGLFILIAISRWSGDANGTILVTMGAFMAAAYKIIPGIVKILNVSGQMHTYAYTLHDLASPRVPAEPAGSIEKIDSIRFSNVCFRYNGSALIEDFNLHLQPGDFLGISGASGRGKTTLVNLLLGFLMPQSGCIQINDSVMAAKQLHWKKLSYIRQQTFLIHDTILKNILLDDQAFDEPKLKQSMEHAGLTDLFGQYPESLNKFILENGKNISGGQRQRIALARALYRDAELIILDEPFNELDENSELSMLQLLQQLAARGKMIILITHHGNSLSFCNKKVCLDA